METFENAFNNPWRFRQPPSLISWSTKLWTRSIPVPNGKWAPEQFKMLACEQLKTLASTMISSECADSLAWSAQGLSPSHVHYNGQRVGHLSAITRQISNPRPNEQNAHLLLVDPYLTFPPLLQSGFVMIAIPSERSNVSHSLGRDLHLRFFPGFEGKRLFSKPVKNEKMCMISRKANVFTQYGPIFNWAWSCWFDRE